MYPLFIHGLVPYSIALTLLSILLRIGPPISQRLFSILDGMYCLTPLDYVKSRNDL